MDEKNPRATYDVNGRLMSVLPSNESDKTESEGYKVANILSVSFAVFGAICFFVGLFFATEDYRFNWLYFLSGILSMMFNFGWAVVMRVCALYMRMNDKL